MSATAPDPLLAPDSPPADVPGPVWDRDRLLPALPSGRAIAVCFVIGVVLIVLATRLDVRLATWVHGHRFAASVQRELEMSRWPGHFAFTLAVAALVWASSSARRQLGGPRAMLLMAATIAPSILGWALKWVFGRIRPFKGVEPFALHPFRDGPLGVFEQTNLSFPSGDATLAFATAATIAAMFPRWAAPAWAWAIVVACARVLQGAHYPSDVTGGAVVGTVGAWLTLALLFRPRRVGSSSRIDPTATPASIES